MFDGSSSPAPSSTGNNFSGLSEKRAAVTEGAKPSSCAESKHLSSSALEDPWSKELKKKKKSRNRVVLIFKMN